MSNIIDYIAWRGDVPFSISQFNEVDALILSQLSYLNMKDIVSKDFLHPVSLKEAAKKFKNAPDFEARSNLGAMISPLSVQLLQDAGESVRFGNMGVCGYRYTLDETRGEQFCAVTFLYEGKGIKWNTTLSRKLHSFPPSNEHFAFVSYRGTDDTIVGWKEDFNMAVSSTVPSQLSAASYLAEAMQSIRHNRFCVGGHSKGGNLAVYAAAMSEDNAKKRLCAVYNMDGPGFDEERLSSVQFQSVLPVLRSYYPQFSIVGMIFYHAGETAAVISDASLIMQHDPFSWQVKRDVFIQATNFDWGSATFHTTINTWLSSVSAAEREAFVETLFKVIEATGAKTNSELESSWFTAAPRAIKALALIKPETRDQVIRMVQALLPAIKKGFSR